MRRWISIALGVAIVFILPHQGQGSRIEGIGYLLENQNLDGSFGTVPWRDTGTVLRALMGEQVADTDVLTRAWGFLLDQDGRFVDPAARVARGLDLVGDVASQPLAVLEAAQNEDGSWGVAPEWPGTTCDTAQALITLAQVGDSDLTRIQAALDFLLDRQLENGAFSWEGNDGTAAPLLTVEALKAMVAWRTVFDLETPIAEVVGYLFSLQEADGLLSCSTPLLLTALTLHATSSLSVDEAAWSEAFAALQEAQLPDGSWDEDPYTTAAAVLALASAHTDLAVAALDLTSAPAVAGTQNGVDVLLTNSGRVASSPVPLVITYTDSRTGETRPVGTATAPSLSAGASQHVTVDWENPGPAGSGYLEAWVDPDDVLGEVRTTNNVLVAAITILGGPDVVVDSADGMVVPPNPIPGEDVTYSSLVASLAAIPLTGVVVTLHDGDPGSGGALLLTETLDFSPGDVLPITWTGTLSEGEHRLYLTADAEDAVVETDESNNEAVTVVDVTPEVDVAVVNVQVHPASVSVGATTTAAVTLINLGRNDAGAFEFALDLQPVGGGSWTQVAAVVVDSLPDDGDITMTFEVPTTGKLGDYTLRGVADVTGVLDELDETNNEATTLLQVLEGPDLTVGSGDFQVDTPIVQGDTPVLHVTVHNTGGSTIQNIPVAFFLDSTSASPIGTETIFQIAAGQASVSPGVVWDTTGVDVGVHTLIALVDPQDTVSEVDEDDNRVEASVQVQPLPDLSVAGLSATPTGPVQGDVVTLTATVDNASPADVTDTFAVAFFLGNPGSGGLLIKSHKVNGLTAGSSESITATWDTTGHPGDSTLYVQIDPESVVVEGSESNNVSVVTVTVTTDDSTLTPVTNLSASVAGDNVTLSWTASSSPDGYRVYEDGKSIGPPDTGLDLVSEAVVSASSAVSGHDAALASDGDTSTWWAGESSDADWVYEIDFGTLQEVAAYRMWLHGSGNLSLSWAFQSYQGGSWITQDSARVSSGSSGVSDSGVKTLPQPVITTRVRLFMSRYTAGTDPAALGEVAVYSTGLVTGTTFERVNAPGGTRVYEVRPASSDGFEGEGVQVAVELGRADPASNPVAVAFSDRVEVSYTPSTSPGVTGYQLVRDGYIPVVDAAQVSGMSGAASSSAGFYYGPSEALDGDSWSYWMSSYGDTNWWFEVGLPRTMRVYGMTIAWGGYYGIDYDIQSWTGTEWILEESVRGESYQVRGFAFPQLAETDKLRIRIYRSSGGNYVTISEIDVEEAIPITGDTITDDGRRALPSNYRLATLTDAFSFYTPEDIPVEGAGQGGPPSPSDLNVSEYSRTDITLDWSPVSGADVAGYRVYDGQGTLLSADLVTQTTWTDVDAIDRDVTTYVYAVAAVTTGGTEGDAASLEWTPPLPATVSLSARSLPTGVQLEWAAPDEPLRESYRVYRNGYAYAEVDGDAFVDDEVVEQSYAYAVAGVDLFGREGALSDTVTVTPVLFDLAADADSIYVTPESPAASDSVQVSALVTNLGSEAGPGADVAFYDGNPDAGGTSIGTVALEEFPGFGTVRVGVSWDVTAAAGTHVVYVVVDPEDTVPEADESNNTASTSVVVNESVLWAITLTDLDPAGFPEVQALCQVADDRGEPVVNLPQRYLSMAEEGTPVAMTMAPSSPPGTYRLQWTSPDPARDGSTRLVTVSLDYPGTQGETSAAYTAPSDALVDVAALSLGPEPAAPLGGESFQLVATIQNVGSVDLAGVVVAFSQTVAGDSVVLARGTLDLPAGATLTPSLYLQASTGETTFEVSVDPDDLLAEKNERDNVQTVTLHVPVTPLPDLEVSSISVVATPTSPMPGDEVTLTAAVVNHGADASDVLVQAYRQDTTGMLTPVGPAVVIPGLDANTAETVSFPWDTTGLEGDQWVFLWADPLDRIAESNESNNVAGIVVTIGAPPATLSIATDKTSYLPETSVAVAAQVVPATAGFAGELRLQLQDEDGNALVTLDPIPVGPISTVSTYTAEVALGASRAGTYRIAGELRDASAVRASASTTFVVEAVFSLEAQVATERPTYGPFDMVSAAGRITNTSVNTDLDDVAGTLTLLDPSGEVWGNSVAIGPVTIGLDQTFPLAGSWALTGGDPGTWQVTLDAVSHGIETHASSSFEVTSTADTGEGLIGTILVQPDQVVPGSRVVVQYEVENRGNDDVVGVDVGILLVGEDDEQVHDTVSFSLDLARGTGVNGEVELDTVQPEGAYLVLLEAAVGGDAATLSAENLKLLSVTGDITADPSVAEGGEDSVRLDYVVTNLSDVTMEDLQLALEVISLSDESVVSSLPWRVTTTPGASEHGSQTLSPDLFNLGSFRATLYLSPAGGHRTDLAHTTFQVVDTRPPVTTLSFTGVTANQDDVTYTTGDTTLALDADDSFSGVAAVRYRLDGVEYLYDMPFTLAYEGPVTMEYYAVDLAGNAEAAHTVALVRDDTAPVIEVFGVSDGMCTAEAVVPEIHVYDGSPVTTSMTLDGNAYAGAEVSTPGGHTLEISSIDILDHSSTLTLAFQIVADACVCLGDDGCATPFPDEDGDGFAPGNGDCNDLDAAVYPGAAEPCDGKDNDCNGDIDDAEACRPTPTPPTTPRRDTDGDGWSADSDCDDADPGTYPSAQETCDARDNDCDGEVDEDAGCFTPGPTASLPPTTPTPPVPNTSAPTGTPGIPGTQTPNATPAGPSVTPASTGTPAATLVPIPNATPALSPTPTVTPASPSPYDPSTLPTVPGCTCSSRGEAEATHGLWGVCLAALAGIVVRRRQTR